VFELKLINDIYIICLVSLMKYFLISTVIIFNMISEFNIKVKIFIHCWYM